MKNLKIGQLFLYICITKWNSNLERCRRKEEREEEKKCKLSCETCVWLFQRSTHGRSVVRYIICYRQTKGQTHLIKQFVDKINKDSPGYLLFFLIKSYHKDFSLSTFLSINRPIDLRL